MTNKLRMIRNGKTITLWWIPWKEKVQWATNNNLHVHILRFCSSLPSTAARHIFVFFYYCWSPPFCLVLFKCSLIRYVWPTKLILRKAFSDETFTKFETINIFLRIATYAILDTCGKKIKRECIYLSVLFFLFADFGL